MRDSGASGSSSKRAEEIELTRTVELPSNLHEATGRKVVSIRAMAPAPVVDRTVGQSRLRTLLVMGVLMAAGLGSRLPRLPDVVTLYVGDVLWGAFFFHGFRFLWPRASSGRLWCLAVSTTELIELSQLWQAPWFNRIRDTRLGGLLLGHGFLVSDMVSVALGASLAALSLALTKRRAVRSVPHRHCQHAGRQ